MFLMRVGRARETLILPDDYVPFSGLAYVQWAWMAAPGAKPHDALCRSSHFPMLELLELMLLSIQLLSVQLSSMYVQLLSIMSLVAFCGMLLSIHNTALCCSQYSVSLHFIQDVIQIIGECDSKITCEVVSWVGSLYTCIHTYMGLFGRLRWEF